MRKVLHLYLENFIQKNRYQDIKTFQYEKSYKEKQIDRYKIA